MVNGDDGMIDHPTFPGRVPVARKIEAAPEKTMRSREVPEGYYLAGPAERRREGYLYFQDAAWKTNRALVGNTVGTNEFGYIANQERRVSDAGGPLPGFYFVPLGGTLTTGYLRHSDVGCPWQPGDESMVGTGRLFVTGMHANVDRRKPVSSHTGLPQVPDGHYLAREGEFRRPGYRFFLSLSPSKGWQGDGSFLVGTRVRFDEAGLVANKERRRFSREAVPADKGVDRINVSECGETIVRFPCSGGKIPEVTVTMLEKDETGVSVLLKFSTPKETHK
jgi:hypothetical protein